MDKRAALDVLARFREALVSQGVHAPRLVLFGSHATGEAREDSDIDVVVISEAFVGVSHWDRITLLGKAICASHVLIEAVPMTQQEWEGGGSLIAEFARDGEEVPAKSGSS